MSPRYERWKDAPKEVRQGIFNITSEEKVTDFKRKGCVGKVKDGEVESVCLQEEVEAWVLKEANRASSPYFKIEGIDHELQKRREKNEKVLQRNYEGITPDNWSLYTGYYNKPYRGNHRSHTKGCGARHFFVAAIKKVEEHNQNGGKH
ncbi:MAG TPA: hypothetical protein VF185_03210 [Patescibacteria group bacterium]